MNFASLLNAMPGAVAQGMIWGIMAIGLYITYSVLNFSDLTVDGTMATGGAVCILLMMAGVNVWVALLCAVLAGMLAGLATGLFHTAMGIPGILSGILTQLSLYSINLVIMDGNSSVTYRYYPEDRESFGSITIRKQDKQAIEQNIADNDETKWYYHKICKVIFKFIDTNTYVTQGTISWY